MSGERSGTSHHRTVKPTVLIVGPVPPPVHGVSQVIGWLVDSPVMGGALTVSHLDTSDRRSSENLGRVDVQNVLIGLKNLGSMFARCVRRRPSVVYYTLSQNVPALLRDAMLAATARLFRCKLVVQLAGARYVDIVEAGGLGGRLVRRALKKASLVLVLGEHQVRSVSEAAGHERVGVAPNGLPIVAAPKDSRRHSGPCTFLFLGSLRARKGVVAALEALAEVTRRGRECRAVFGGSWANPDERECIVHTVEALGLTDAVEFPGLVEGEQKQTLLREADVYLLPSLGEGQPVSILEAMAHGLPVISTRVGAVPDTVLDGQTGILVEPGDVPGLADAMARVVDDEGLRARMGRAGASRFSECFTLQRSHEILRDHLTGVCEAS